MVPILSLFDDIDYSASPRRLPRADSKPTIAVTTDSADVPGGAANLAYRAAELLLN